MPRPVITARSGELYRIQLEASLDWLEANSGVGGGQIGIGDISGLPQALSAKSDVGHSHVISDVAGLQSAIDAKASLSHSHSISDVSGLSAALPKRGQISVTVPNNSLEWEQVVAVAGVAASDYIILSLAGYADSDENAADMIDLIDMAATPGTNQITVTMAFSSLMAGAIKLNWIA